MAVNSMEHKICSDMIINNDVWVMNTFWMRNAKNLPQEKLTNDKKEHPLALCYSLLLFVLSSHQQRITGLDLYSLGLSDINEWKIISPGFVCFIQNTKMILFFRYHDSVHKPNNRFLGSNYFKHWGVFDLQYVQFFSQLCLCSRWWEVFLLIRGLNQRGDLKTPPFSYIDIFFQPLKKAWRENGG